MTKPRKEENNLMNMQETRNKEQEEIKNELTGEKPASEVQANTPVEVEKTKTPKRKGRAPKKGSSATSSGAGSKTAAKKGTAKKTEPKKATTAGNKAGRSVQKTNKPVSAELDELPRTTAKHEPATTMVVYMTVKDKAMLKKYADKQGLSAAKVISMLIQKYCK